MLKKQIVIVSVVLVLLFLPVIVYAQTAILFTVKGTVKNPDDSNADNGLAVEVKNVTAEEKIGTLVSRNTTTGIAKIAKDDTEDDTEDDMDPAYSVTFTPYKGNIAAAVGDIIEVRVYNNQGGLFDKEVSYTLTQEDIDRGWARVDVPPPCHTFTICLAEGPNIIAIPVDTTSERCEPKIERVSDLAALLGNDWALIATFDSNKNYQSFIPGSPIGGKADTEIKRGAGLVVQMKQARQLEITGESWPEGDIQLTRGPNLIGIPLKSADLERVSDLIDATGGDCITTISSFDTAQGKYRTFIPGSGEGVPANVFIDGDVGLIISAKKDCIIPITTGDPWSDKNRRKPCP